MNSNSRKKQDRQDRLRRQDMDLFFLISNILPPKVILSFFLIWLIGCSNGNPPHEPHQWDYFAGRNTLPALDRPLVYRAKVPDSWQREDPSPTVSIQDSRTPLVEFIIQEGKDRIRMGEEITCASGQCQSPGVERSKVTQYYNIGSLSIVQPRELSRSPDAQVISSPILRVTVHNFPTSSLAERVLPAAQISRWKTQFDTLEPGSVIIHPISRGGFSGLYFEASGIQHGKPITVMGWSLQLAQEHYNALALLEGDLYFQMRSDYTLKAVGSPDAVLQHKKSIVRFANSFELINEIPPP